MSAVPQVSDTPGRSVPAELIGPSPVRGVARLVKRAIDLGVALPLAVATAPVLGLLALFVRLDSPGPVLFLQERLGQGGRTFVVYKLRTMTEGAVGEGHLHKAGRDPRVTRLGRLLRRTSLDELPQLWNVVRGDLSLVGPRPELPEFAFRYYEDRTWRRLAVAPGLTGKWQVEGRHLQPMYAHPELDLAYVETWSLLEDVSLLVRTPLAVIRGRGAY